MSTIAEAEGFDMLRWRESLRKSCYETTDVKVINGIAEDFVDMVRYLDGEVNDTLQWVEGHLPVDKKLLASKRWMCKFHQMDMEELSVEGEGIAAAKERALKLFLVVGYMASALKDAEELRANAEKSLKEKELASKRWTYEIYIMNMAMFTVAMFVAIGDRASKLISVVSKATEGTLRLNEIAKLRRELSSAKKLIIALTLEVDDKQKTLDACLQRESELRQRETRSKRRKGDLATRVATTARRRGSRGDRVESDKDTADESDIDTTRYPSSSSAMLDDFDVAGSEEGTHAKVVDKGKASEASLGGKSALQQKIAELETKLRTTRNKRSKRRKGDLARRVANTVGGFRVERTGSDKIPSSSAEARPANLDSCAPEDRTQVEGEQPDVSVMGCCSGVPSAKTHIQHGFTREMGRIGASALGSSRLPRVLIWDAILKEQQRRCGEGDSDDGKNEVRTNFLPRHNHHEHLHREGTIHDIFFG